MKFDVLHNFISPVTGRILCDPNFILVGDVNGIAIPSMTIPIGVLPDLPMGNIWIGDAMNRPIANPNINVSNLPNLAEDNIWVGDDTNRPVESSRYVRGPVFPTFTVPFNVAIWNDFQGKFIGDSGFNVVELQALSAVARAAAATAVAAAEEAIAAAAAATAAAFLSFFGGGGGGRGRTGAAGAAGAAGLAGPPGAAGVSGKNTLTIDANISVLGGRIQDIAPSPEADYDAVSAKWVWDLLNDNVEIRWE